MCQTLLQTLRLKSCSHKTERDQAKYSEISEEIYVLSFFFGIYLGKYF